MANDKERIHRWLTQADLDEMLAQAFRRGAEAMREAAVTHIKRNIIGDSVHAVLICRVYQQDIGELPLPEDKP